MHIGSCSQDSNIRPNSTQEKLDGLKLAFDQNGSVTAATSSPLTDGAAATLICEEQYAKDNNLKNLEFLSCIPGSIGGANIMNSGCYENDISKILIYWEIVSINPNDKFWNWNDLFCFWAVSIQSVIGFSLITSLYLIYNLNTFVVIFGTLLGTLLVYFFSNFLIFVCFVNIVFFPLRIDPSLFPSILKTFPEKGFEEFISWNELYEKDRKYHI